MKEGHIFTDGEIGADYPDQIAAQIARIGEVDKIIHHVSSPGGNVIAGYKGYHKLIELGKPIDTIVEGEAQSMGSFVMMASNVTGGKIKILNPSRVMIHNPKFNVQGLTTSGFADSDALQSGANELKTIEQEMAEVYANSTVKRGKTKTVDEIKAMMKLETYMSAQDAVNLGFADEVINYIPKEENTKLKAVALGLTGTKPNTTMEKEKSGGITSAVVGVLKKAISALEGAAAVDLPLKEGGVISVDGEGVTVGANATIDGQPADGAYVLEDGQTVKCVGGKVTEIMPAAPMPSPPQEDEKAKMTQQIQQLQQQLATKQAAETAQIAEEQKKVIETAKSESEQVKTALAKATEELEKLKKATVGDASKQNEGMEANRTAFAIGNRNAPNMQAVYASRSFMADNLPQYEQAYPGGKYKDGTRYMDYRSGGPCAVSILETNFSYTWNGVLSLDLFFKPTLNSPAMSDLATIDTGAKDSKRYHIAPTFSKVLKPYTGCDQAVTGSSFNITDKKIQLKPFQMYESFCKDDFTDQLIGLYNVLAQEWLKSGNESFDPAGTPIDRMIVEGLKDALRIDTYRRIMFADTSSSDADYNQIDGYWTNLIDQSGASNYCVYRYGDGLGVGTLSAGTANTYLQGIYENSNLLLRQEGIATGRAKFYVTQSVWDNYFTYLVGVGAVTEQAYTTYLKGSNNLTYRGIPVVPVPIWDSFLAESDNPLTATTRHLISLSIKENHIIGVENTADLGKIDSWFEKKDNKRYYRSNMTMGFLGAIHCDLTSISY